MVWMSDASEEYQALKGRSIFMQESFHPAMARINFVFLALVQMLLAGLFQEVSAQNYPLQKRIFIISAPSGTNIQLKGPYTFFGKTPFTISQNLVGLYSLVASKRGFESKNIKIDFNEYASQTLTITMRPLSRLKSTYRSLLFPGWGQRYKGVPGRGLLFTGLVFGAGVGTFMAHSTYQSDRDDAELARKNYFNSLDQDFASAQIAWENWQSVHRRAQKSYDRYERAIIITSSLWALNVIDALLFPPGPSQAGSAQAKKINFSSRTDFSRAQIQLTISFNSGL